MCCQFHAMLRMGQSLDVPYSKIIISPPLRHFVTPLLKERLLYGSPQGDLSRLRLKGVSIICNEGDQRSPLRYFTAIGGTLRPPSLRPKKSHCTRKVQCNELRTIDKLHTFNPQISPTVRQCKS